MLKITEIGMDYEKTQVGITRLPEFNWTLESDKRSVTQESFRIELSADADFGELIYDSGTVASSESVGVKTEGVTLESHRRYFARVKVTASGEKSGWAYTGFVTGILNADEWKGGFITAETQEDKESSKGTLLRKTFSLKEGVREAYISATALGLYQLYLNGVKVGEDSLTPGWTSYKKHLCFQTYDITKYLKAGENALGAMLAPGWYKGRMGFEKLVRKYNLYGDETALLIQATIRYEDGTQEILSTDSSWAGADSPVIFANIYDGEIYDASLEIDGWAGSGEIKGDWRAVREVQFDKAVLSGQGSAKPADIDAVKAVSVFRTPKGDTVVDFGQNMSARIQVSAFGKPGDKIVLDCFETLDAEGNVYRGNLRTAKERLEYRFGRAGKAVYRPSFTFMGFRYARITAFPGEPEPENFTAFTVHTRMERTGFLTTSDPDLNRLLHNILWGLKSNFVDIPMDCPQRDERLGWTGDAQIFCRTACFLMNADAFYRKWLTDVAAEQTPEGGVPHVVPDIISGNEGNDTFMRQGSVSAAGWADAAVILPWTLYTIYGDEEILRRQYDSMKRWIDFMQDHAVDYIWNYKLQFGDWLALDAEEGSYFGATPTKLTNTAYFAYSSGLFAKIAKILGKEEDAEVYGELHKNVAEKFRNTYFDKDGNMTVQTQTAHVLALHFGLVNEKYRAKTAAALARLVAKENGHLVTGFMGTPYICHALSDNGYVREAYDLLLKDDFPSWLYQVKAGATTVWEHWDSLRPDGSMWSADMNSFNHYSYGSIAEWMIRVIGGLNVDEENPGCRRVIIYPRLGGGLSSARFEYRSVRGTFKSVWELEGDTVTLNVSIPPNARALICADKAEEITDADGLEFGYDDPDSPVKGVWSACAGSGEYTIRYRKQEEDA